MCGILGGRWFAPPVGLEARVQNALYHLHTRGPDHQAHDMLRLPTGTLVLGHTRLSIIDLTPQANQPMHSQDGRYSIVFNGEIYNYKEIRKELGILGHGFTTDSDTEVLLKAWAHWGCDCLTRLVGMFAFAVHDRQRNTLTCVRDAFGIKPFFYTTGSGYFAFASELPALITLTGAKPIPDWQRAYDYLVHGDYDTGERTSIADVLHLLPGHLMTLDLDTGLLPAPARWWQPPVKQSSTLNFGEAAEALREQFLDSIRLHLRSDVPLGVALSGGIDSSAIACAMRHIDPESPIHTFSYIAEGSDLSEEAWVDKVNAHVGALPHKVIASGEELLRDLEDMVGAQGEPFGSTSIYAQYRVFKMAKETGITVLLDGQGADEMLAGYVGYPGERMLSLLEQGEIRSAMHFASRWRLWPGRNHSAWQHLAGLVLPDDAYKVARKWMGRPAQPPWIDSRFLSEVGVNLSAPRYRMTATGKGRRVIEKLANALTRNGLPHLLRHEDRNAMHFSIESRVPFLTIPLANFLLSLPESYLISSNGETKRLFRAAMRGIMPDDVLDRRDKIGFATPEKAWLMRMKPIFRNILEKSDHVPLFRRQPLLNAFDKVLKGESPFGWHVWRWVNYILWYDRFISGNVFSTCLANAGPGNKLSSI